MNMLSVAIAAVMVCCAQAAHAETVMFKPGDRELVFSGSLSKQSTEVRAQFNGPDLVLLDEDATVLILTGTYGYFLTGRHEIGALGGVIWVDDGGSDWDALGGVSYTLNLGRPDSTMVPTVGALVRTILFDGISDYTYGVNAGVRMLANDAISVNSQLYYEYTRAEDQSGGLDLLEEDTAIGIRLGFSWILR